MNVTQSTTIARTINLAIYKYFIKRSSCSFSFIWFISSLIFSSLDLLSFSNQIWRSLDFNFASPSLLVSFLHRRETWLFLFRTFCPFINMIIAHYVLRVNRFSEKTYTNSPFPFCSKRTIRPISIKICKNVLTSRTKCTIL